MSPKTNHHVFEVKAAGIARELVTSVVLQDPITKRHVRIDRAIWDTGATNSCVNKSVAAQLGVVPTGKTSVVTASGSDIVNTFVIEMVLPNHVTVRNLLVSEGNLGINVDMLIGMDVIGHGDFVVQNNNGKTEFSFCYPAFETKYDMLKKANTINTEPPK